MPVAQGLVAAISAPLSGLRAKQGRFEEPGGWPPRASAPSAIWAGR